MDTRDFAAGWLDIGALDEVPRQGARRVASLHGPIAIFRTHDDAVFALDDRCPHKGGPLSQGIVHGHAVTCPLHNWVIDLASGEAVAPDHGCVRRIPVRVEAGRILIGLPPGARQ
jgi:nitrite reductase (NADH) small subunit